ncbi:MAG: UDP-N-acetylmuramoyl-L-alanyl-D-glutamate--2,6-diaminopimelate ligase [Limnohabitans sp.]|jgi:UDP-N-acetylmuramoyl-L-alanyl-D-glutamate--2,6-diaminopimelate ligase|nr:UDP-N-acetylmuramoyl-L-alanyl-D-glutamate--2,6-diaminopimelate ligase [Limnohabitans sp.]
MKCSTLLAGLPLRVVRDADPDIWSLTEDSRRVKRGALFVARGGTKQDGSAFIMDAIRAGAVCVVAPRGTQVIEPLPPGVVWCEADDTPLIAALVAERFFGQPTRSLALMGVTGTNGKTTIAYLVQQLLAHAGKRCGLIGTVEIDDGAKRTASSLTTPPAMELSELFARMVDHGCVAAAMEVSSHSLDQRRVAALRFQVGIFTNLTGDHLDYHGTMERYAAAKAVLFGMLDEHGTAVINIDDPWHRFMLPPSARLLRVSLKDASAECFGTVHRMGLSSMDVTFRGPWGTLELTLPLVGAHNAMNALEATAAAWALGVSAEQLGRALLVCQAPPGRLQPVALGGSTPADGFSVLVDYAHSDDALANVLRALRPTVPAGGRLRVVFGCGGDRDRTKRPRMAKVACDGADGVIVTSDNPRTENPEDIIQEILEGVPVEARHRVEVEPDRARAIAHAVSTAREGDIILIAGKGHEDYQIIGTEKRSFDDRREAEAALRSRRGG